MPPHRPTQPPEGTGRKGCHVGVLVPWANSVVEAELPRWAGTEVIWHYARLVPPGGTTALDESFLDGLLAAVPVALTQLAALPLKRVYLACTSAAFMRPDQAKAAAADCDVPVVTAFDAIMAALRWRRARRIVLLTPYPHQICDTEAATFEDRGIAITGRVTLDLADGYSIIEPGQVRSLVDRAGMRAVEEAQAIVLSCTGWPTYGLEKALAHDVRKEVFSSNLAIAMHALRTRNEDGL